MIQGNIVIILDESGCAVDVSFPEQRLFDPDAVIGKPPADIFHDYPTLLQLFGELQADATPSSAQEVILNVDGQDYYLMMQVNRMRQNGTVITLRDITEQKQTDLLASQHYAELATLRSIDERISSTLDMDEVLQIALAYALDMSGGDAGFISLLDGDDAFQRVVCVAGQYPQTYLDRVFPVDYGIFGRVLHNQIPELIPNVHDDPDYHPVIADTQAQIIIPLLAYDRTIGLLNLETQGSTTFTPQTFDFACIMAKRFAMAIANAQLYTIAQNHLEELQQLYEQVSKLEQEKTHIIRIAAHNLRGPIGTITGYLDLMQIDGDRVDPEHREWVDTMKGLAQRLDDIITDILSLERAQQGSLQESADLGDLIENLVRNYQAEARLKPLKLRMNRPEDTVIVHGDPVQLREAIGNLISNAIKYTPENGLVEVNLYQDKDKITVEVVDNGYGIPEELQGRLFEPFYRAVSSETRNIDGTGLGLHLVKSIIERHNGQMRFKSVHGEGSTFGFTLPRRRKWEE